MFTISSLLNIFDSSASLIVGKNTRTFERCKIEMESLLEMFPDSLKMSISFFAVRYGLKSSRGILFKATQQEEKPLCDAPMMVIFFASLVFGRFLFFSRAHPSF